MPILTTMASTTSYRDRQQNAFSEIGCSNKRRKVDQSSKFYDVFINHRGPDVKLTLATNLYNYLKERDIRAFLDYKERELGDSLTSTIETAISSAKVHIAIFSQRYAESPWCLAELALMLESKAKIIPVFYQVEPWEVKPSDLRHIEKGVYNNAFLNYEKKGRYLDKIEEWKETLQKVSYTIGYEFKSTGSCDYEEIVSAVEKEVQRTKYLHVAKHPVGLHKLVRDFEWKCLLDLVHDFESQCRINRLGKIRASVVGIFGMGGVGKTTLSKQLYNQYGSEYTRKCFLSDVRESSARGELLNLQSQLLEELFREKDRRFRNLAEGTSCLMDYFEKRSHSSFLIVLDDIDHVDQLEALIQPVDVLNRFGNHLVIITTRDVGVLVAAGIEVGYHLRGLDREDGRELFCWHSFRQPKPRSGYEDIVETFVSVCGGLPLSLQVLGRHVSGKDLLYWRAELEKVRRTLPKDVKKTLKISFDSLDYEEKQVFMDVACFFVGKSKTMAMTIWEGSGWSSHHALQILKDKCLVEEEEKTHGSLKDRKSGFVLRMHDHLRDLGREMAKELNHPHRMWHSQHLKSLELKGFQNILTQNKSRCFHWIRDESMRCQITYFVGEPKDSSQTLLWFHLDYLKYYELIFNPDMNPSIPSFLWRRLVVNSDINTSIPVWIPLENLQCLRISGGFFRRLWHGDMQAPAHLKELQIVRTCLEEIPDLSGKSVHMEDAVLDGNEFQMYISSLSRSHYSCLEKIELDNCNKLQSIMLPTTLVRLSLKSCRNLNRVAGNLTRLIEFCINDCPELQELPSLCRVICVKKVEINSCQQLKKITLPTTLISVSIKSCRNLQRIHGDLSECAELYISDCSELEELPGLCKVNCLNKAEIYSCHKLKKIALPTKLISVSVKSCRNLQRIDGDLSACRAFFINDCHHLEVFPDFGRVSCSEQIEIKSCDKLHDITLPTTLIRLSIGSCRDLQRVAAGLTKLTALYINDCPQLDEFPCFSGLSCLEQIRFYSCKKLKFIQLPIALISLSVRKCRDLQRVTGDVTKLTALYIRDCPELEQLPSLSIVSCLEQIAVFSCKKLKQITLPTTLTSLSIRSCRGLQGITVNGDLANLKRLIIAHCPELEEFPTICGKSEFITVVIDTCEKLQTISVCEDLQTVLNGKDFQTPSDGKGLPITSDDKGLHLRTTSVGEGLEDLTTTSAREGLHVSKYLRLWYCSNAIIQNSIHMLKNVPWRMDMIGRATVTAELTLIRLQISCDSDFGVGAIRPCRNYIPNWSTVRSVIACFVVIGLCTSERYMRKLLSKYHYSENDYRYDYEFDSDSDSDSESYHGLSMRRGKWIVTMVASDKWSYSCLEEVENLLCDRGIRDVGFYMEMKRGEEEKSLHVLRSIVDSLHC